MGFTDTFRDFYESLTFSNELHAEAPSEEDEEEPKDEEGEDKSGGDEKEEGEGEGEGGEGEEEGGEAEEEEEEPEDIKPKLEADCARSAQCAPLKHHFEECTERVTRAQEDPDFKGPHEDCVEEFFHLQHCATQCAAPKLFQTLK